MNEQKVSKLPGEALAESAEPVRSGAWLGCVGLEPPVETGSSSGLVGVGGLWKQSEAIALCIQIEAICPSFGCHVALTGGALYKQGPRKDCDLILYRIRQCPQIEFEGLFAALETIGVVKVSGFGFCHKAEFKGKRIDFLAPEEEGGYGEEEGGGGAELGEMCVDDSGEKQPNARLTD